jgi:hypothetical protein
MLLGYIVFVFSTFTNVGEKQAYILGSREVWQLN